MRINMNSMKLNSLLTLSLLLVVSCAKDKPYDEKYKEEKLHPKSAFVVEEKVVGEDGKERTVPVEYLYVPSSLGTPMEVVEAAPFVQGQEKVVKMKWVEEGLSIYEVERDERFEANQLNHTPVLTIPGDYLSYRCQEDAYGDCTNKEEENTELEWYEKDQFKPNFEKMKVHEVNTLDASLIDWSGCLSASSAKLLNYDVSAGVINIELEKTYTVNKSNPICTIIGAYYKDSAESSFDVRYFYSLVRLDSVASPDYEAVEYPVPDQNDFGFFNDEELVLKEEFDRQRPDRKILMNRWNPNQKNGEIVYYLSPEYSKPKNKIVLDATHEAVKAMNREMGAADIPFKIRLVEQPDPKKAVSPGDIRYNSLVLIEDPLANGLLGYGPSVKNPYTGEIVQAHTNMYLGVLKSMTRRVYEQAVDLTQEEAAAAAPAVAALNTQFEVAESAITQLPNAIKSLYPLVATPEATPAVPSEDPQEQGEGTQSLVEDSNDKNIQAQVVPMKAPMAFKRELPQELLNHDHARHLIQQAKQEYHSNTIHKASKISIDQLISKLKEHSSDEFSEIDEALLKQEKKWKFLAENNAFSADFFPIAGTSKVVYPELREIADIQTPQGTLKRWDNLNQDQKDLVGEIILKNSYKATLIHELGHNLGLRHNFMGSHDHENFYTEEEARSLGLEAAPAYSSIMDYSFSEFNQLKVFGKYDIAALRFGYKREVELTNGNFMKIQGSLQETVQALKESQAGVDPAQEVRVKPFEFCTDENTNLGNLCNRFDEGTNLKEIINYRIKSYKDNYKYRNFRDGRIRYSTYDMPSYIYARSYELGRIRDIIEDNEYSKEFWRGYLPELLLNYDIVLTEEQLDQVLNVSCSGVFGEGVWFCDDYIDDGREAVEIAGNFFLELLKTPDHLCALVTQETPNVIVEYRTLYNIYDKIKGDIDNVPHSCFDSVIKEHVAKDGLLVVGENGKFINGFKDTDPNYRYAQDRYARGIWPDKIYAMRYLFKRRSNFSTTDENFGAIIDYPNIAEKADNIFSHLILGTELESPLPFTTESGQQFQVPYVIGNDYSVNPLEDYFGDLARSLRMSPKGETDLRELMLSQVEREHTAYGKQYKNKAFASRNLLAVQRTYGFIPLDARTAEKVYFYDPNYEVTYSASRVSPYAFEMISAINNFDFLNAQEEQQIRVAVNLQNFVGFPIPDGVELDAGQTVFFGMNKATMEQILNLSQQQVSSDNINFRQILGEEDGAAIEALYNKGFNALAEIYQLKVQIFESILSNSTDDEKRLLTMDGNLLMAFANGSLNEEIVEYYIEQLTKLPSSQRHQNAM